MILALIFGNAGIGFLGCVVAGYAWKDTMILGKKAQKMLLHMTVVWAGIGFSIVPPAVCTWIAIHAYDGKQVPTLIALGSNDLSREIFHTWMIVELAMAIGAVFCVCAGIFRWMYRDYPLWMMSHHGLDSKEKACQYVEEVSYPGRTLLNFDEFKAFLTRGGTHETKLSLAVFALFWIIVIFVGGIFASYNFTRFFSKLGRSRTEEYAETLQIK